MGLQFRPPSFMQPRDFSFIEKGLDGIFQAYERAKLFERTSQRQGVEDMMRYGFRVADVTPKDFNAAQQRYDATGTMYPRPAQPGAWEQPGNFVEQQGPRPAYAEQAQGLIPDESGLPPLSPTAQRVLDHIRRTKGDQAYQSALQSVTLREKESAITANEAKANFFNAGGMGPEIETDAETGFKFLVERTPSGVRRKPLPGQDMGSEGSVKVGLARDGLANLDDLEQMLNDPEARELMLRGGGYNGLSQIGSAKAERLANAIFQVADSETRLKTGAAVNNQELEAYFANLVRKTGTMEGTKDRLTRKRRYFQGQEQLLTTGKALPPGLQGGSGERTVRLKGPQGLREAIYQGNKFVRWADEQ